MFEKSNLKIPYYFWKGIANDILSWKAFIPLARLNYCVYLINLNYITFYISRSRVPFYYTLLGLFHYGTGMIVMVYMLAFATSLAVEVPFLNLEKVIFPRGESLHSCILFFVSGLKVWPRLYVTRVLYKYYSKVLFA